jgi:hypothetical protein
LLKNQEIKESRINYVNPSAKPKSVLSSLPKLNLSALGSKKDNIPSEVKDRELAETVANKLSSDKNNELGRQVLAELEKEKDVDTDLVHDEDSGFFKETLNERDQIIELAGAGEKEGSVLVYLLKFFLFLV